MARRIPPSNPQLPYHVMARSNNREWFFLPLEELWDVCIFYLGKVQKMYDAQIIAFVLMSNHYHLLIRTPRSNLGEIMNYFQREVSKCVGRKTERINHLFGGSYKGCLIDSDAYLYHVYKYVYRNPADELICEKVEDYQFSTIQGLVRDVRYPFTLMDDIAAKWCSFPREISSRLDWLNVTYGPKERELIAKGLRRGKFSFSKSNAFRKSAKKLSRNVLSTFREDF